MGYGTKGQLIHDLQLAIGQLNHLLDQQNGLLKQIQDSITNVQNQIDLVNLRLANLEQVVGTCTITNTINAPLPNATISGSVLFQCTVSDAGAGHSISKVELYFDTTFIGTMTLNAGKWEKTVDTRGYANRTYTIKMRAYCNKGNTKEASQGCTIDNYIPPGGAGGTYGCTVSVSFISPANGSFVSPGSTFKIKVRASDSVEHGIKSVSCIVQITGFASNEFGLSNVGGPFWEATVTLPSVSYAKATITVTATCEQSKTGSSSVQIIDSTWNPSSGGPT